MKVLDFLKKSVFVHGMSGQFTENFCDIARRCRVTLSMCQRDSLRLCAARAARPRAAPRRAAIVGSADN